MPDSQQPHYVANRVESIQREVSRGAVRDHEFAQFAFCAMAYERVIREDHDCIENAPKRLRGGLRRLFEQELADALEVGECLGRIDYLRHLTGLGRFTASPRTLAAT